MTRTLKYSKDLKPFARNLRSEGTKGEAILWFYALKAKKMNGHQFNRQYPIGNYIVDFVCRKLSLIIEIDGSSHFSKSESDFTREEHLTGLGFHVLRFSEAEVVNKLDDIVGAIYYAVESLEKNSATK